MRQHCWTTNYIKFQQQKQTMLIRNTLQKKQQLNNHNKQHTNEIQNVNKQYERTHDLVSSDFVFAPTHKRDQQKENSN